MMARRSMLWLTAGGAAALLGGCGSRNALRYKMTVEVDTPEGVKSGFAVRELTYDAGSSWFPFGESRGRIYVKGDAVAIDLPGRRALFALLAGADGNVDYAGQGISTIFRVMDRRSGSEGGPHELWPHIPSIREPITNPMPMLVTFRDIDDPTSVERVDPANLTVSFGPGVRLKRITVEATDEDVTIGIERRLEWLVDKNRKRFDPSNKPEGIPLGNYRRLFSTEFSK